MLEYEVIEPRVPAATWDPRPVCEDDRLAQVYDGEQAPKQHVGDLEVARPIGKGPGPAVARPFDDLVVLRMARGQFCLFSASSGAGQIRRAAGRAVASLVAPGATQCFSSRWAQA